MSQLCKILSGKTLLQTFSRLFNVTPLIRHKATKKYDEFEKRYILVRSTPDDYPKIMDLFWNSFYMEEPTVVGIGLHRKRNPVFEIKVLEALAQGMSLIVKCRSTGAIVGSAVNTAICPWDPDMQDEFAENCRCRKTAQLLHFLAHVSRAPDLWCTHCEMKIYEVAYLTTRSADRKKGIGYRLLKKSLDLGKDLSYNVLRVDATSQFTADICEKLKMRKVYEIPYKSYIGPDGYALISPPPPHLSVKVYIQLPHEWDGK